MQYKTRYIVSAFDNQMDWAKVEEFTQALIQDEIFNEFPPIAGFETIIDESDLGKNFIRGFEADDGEIKEEHIGIKAWVVTDGHHRAFAFNKALEKTGLLCFNHIETVEDYSCVTKQENLTKF